MSISFISYLAILPAGFNRKPEHLRIQTFYDTCNLVILLAGFNRNPERLKIQTFYDNCNLDNLIKETSYFQRINLSSIKGTLMQVWKSAKIFFTRKSYVENFILKPLSLFDMRTWGMWKVCLQTFRNNRICWKLAYSLRNLQTSRANNSRILRIKNAKFSGYCFYMNTNI